MNLKTEEIIDKDWSEVMIRIDTDQHLGSKYLYPICGKKYWTAWANARRHWEKHQREWEKR